MNAPEELHLIFGTGPVGISLATELLKQGKSVRLVNRSGHGQVPAGAELVAGDASQLPLVQDLCHGAAVVYNCTHAPYQHWPEVLPRLQENLIEGAASAGARLVVIDTLYLYGETQGQPMTEATPHLATSRKGRLRAELAWGYLQAHRTGKVQVALARAADFFGPQVLNSFLGQYFFPSALNNQPVATMGDIDLPHSYSYMPDIARGLAILGDHEEAMGREWLLPVVKAPTTREVCLLVGKALGHPLEILNVSSVEQAREFGVFDETFAYEYKELFYQYLEPQIVDSSLFEQTFTVKPTPLAEALQHTIHWYQEQAR
ncbi:NAD-dependent epimerase/dehydratase family protein [Dictyobacter kobayashii]|uniref:Epimerase n=1 Tax=Dictyobacter kobayashii TaxID=2014872 RepID=A0A402AUZ2_9CHLR|nr:NAD-dependent epimerase/dehydratase family protein [Dictyobacter kobayashii]GCE22938.1 epimerase [Dictyobacter kobayashii]